MRTISTNSRLPYSQKTQATQQALSRALCTLKSFDSQFEFPLGKIPKVTVRKINDLISVGRFYINILKTEVMTKHGNKKTLSKDTPKKIKTTRYTPQAMKASQRMADSLLDNEEEKQETTDRASRHQKRESKFSRKSDTSLTDKSTSKIDVLSNITHLDGLSRAWHSPQSYYALQSSQVSFNHQGDIFPKFDINDENINVAKLVKLYGIMSQHLNLIHGIGSRINTDVKALKGQIRYLAYYGLRFLIKKHPLDHAQDLVDLNGNDGLYSIISFMSKILRKHKEHFNNTMHEIEERLKLESQYETQDSKHKATPFTNTLYDTVWQSFLSGAQKLSNKYKDLDDFLRPTQEPASISIPNQSVIDPFKIKQVVLDDSTREKLELLTSMVKMHKNWKDTTMLESIDLCFQPTPPLDPFTQLKSSNDIDEDSFEWSELVNEISVACYYRTANVYAHGALLQTLE
jgi:hypothetical protein